MTTTIELDDRYYSIECEGDDDSLALTSIHEIIEGRYVDVTDLVAHSEEARMREIVREATGYGMSRHQRMGIMRARDAGVD